MYKSMYTDTKPYTWSNGKKVDVVCTMMQQVLEKDLEANFLPIISCLVRNSLSKNESALLKIQAMRGKNSIIWAVVIVHLLNYYSMQV